MTTKRWYYFLVGMTILSLVDIFSRNMFRPTTNADLGIISIILGYSINFVLGKSIASFVMITTSIMFGLWFIWPIGAYTLNKKLKGKVKKAEVKKEK